MAGQSPDRSEQQKAPGGSPGGPASVPAPSKDGGDPRLAMAREEPGRVDQPTAMFGTLPKRDEPSASPAPDKTPPEGGTVASGRTESGKPGDDGGDRGDQGNRGDGGGSRGHDAGTGAEAERDESGERNESGGRDARGKGREGAAAGAAGGDARPAGAPDAGESGKGAEDSGAQRGADGTDDTGEGAKAGGDAKGAKAGKGSRDAKGAKDAEGAAGDASAGAAGVAGTAGSAGPDEPTGPTGSEQSLADTARLRAAVAAWVTGDEAGAPAAPERSERPERSEQGGKVAADGADAGAEGGQGRGDGAGSGAEERSGGPDRAGGERGGDSKTTALRAFRPAPPVDQPTTALKVDGFGKQPKPASGSTPTADPAGPADPGTPGSDAPGPKAGREAKAAPGSTEAAPAPKTAREPGAGPGTEPHPKSPGNAPTKAPQDTFGMTQPLPRHDPAQAGPSAGGPGAPAEGGAGGPGAGAGAKPESDLERTSKFVALKPLDVPAPPAPPQGRPPQGRPGQRAGTATPGGQGGAPWPAQPAPSVPPVSGPRQPLDLLAELTNTPPPPQTPLRTALRRVKIWTPVAVLLLVVFMIVQAVRPLPDPTFTLTAAESYSFDGAATKLPWPTEGQGWLDVSGVGTMDHFGAQQPVPIGSVAKAMTAYLVLKDHPLKPGAEGPKITVDATAEKEGGYDSEGESTLNTIKKGDKLTEQQALAAIMIPSANNVARLLARWDAGSNKAFVEKMNATAKRLGMKHTTYTDPSGLTSTTVSTAEDQVKLADELVKIPALMAITKLPSWTDPSGKSWRNYNNLVPFNGAIGIKTGSTTKAGGNLVFAATKETGGQVVTVVGAILGQHKGPSIIDTVNAVSKTAMLAARDALKSATILKKGDVVGYVDDGLGGRTPVVVTKDVAAVGWSGLRVGLSLDDPKGKTVPHEAKAGTVVGTLSIGGSGKSSGTGGGTGSAIKVPVALQKDLTEPGFGAKLTRIG